MILAALLLVAQILLLLLLLTRYYAGKKGSGCARLMRLSLLSPTYPRLGYRWEFVGDLSPKFVPRVGAFAQLLYKY